jgi:hypothetical protein
MTATDAEPRGRRGRRRVHVGPLPFVPVTRALFAQVVRRPCLRQLCFHVTVPVTRRMPDEGAGSVTRRDTVQRRLAQRAVTRDSRGETPSVVLAWPEKPIGGVVAGGAGTRGVSGDGICVVGTLAGVTGVEPEEAHAVPPALRASCTHESPVVSPAATV